MKNNEVDNFSDEIKNIKPRPLSSLTYKIMGINVITITILAMSFSYIAKTRTNLIQNEISNFEIEARMYASTLNRELKFANKSNTDINEILHSLNMHGGQQVTLYNSENANLTSYGTLPQRKAYSEIHDKSLDIFSRGFAAVENLLSVNFTLPPFPGIEEIPETDITLYQQTIDGLNIAAWSAPDGGLILSARMGLTKNDQNIKTLQLVRRDMRIEDSFAETRLAVFRFSLISLTITVAFSLYLAGVIGHPLRRLAMAAETFRLNRGRNVEIPDLSDRDDEIGELSHVMREMTEALKHRLNAIEQFAADVAHELKNPITSMKSALETLPKVKDDKDRQQLMGVLIHDLQRMDRLISDISQASRLDAELSRDVLLPIDINDVLKPLIQAKSDPSFRHGGEREGKIVYHGLDKPAYTLGQVGRLTQVFDNLVSNALSFSKGDAAVTVIAEANDERIKISVEDEGPGIPESRLEKIFDRFYSERPNSEGFGLHSGLGLSIAKQIVESHNGTIHAENRKDAAGNIIGARFVVRLGRVQK